MAKIGDDISIAKKILEEGGLVGMPTETVYGLAGNAYDALACANIFKVKGRPSFDPLIVHTNDVERIAEFAYLDNDKLSLLADRFWPGPLTVILRRKQVIPDLVTSGLETVAVRIPNHPLALSLLESLDFPLAAPSANPFGYISPTSAKHVNDQLGEKINYILDGGHSKVGIESTIIDFESDIPKVLRLGGLEIEQIEEQIGEVEVNRHSTSNPKAPGMLKSHYAPSKPVILGDVEKLLLANNDFNLSEVGILTFTKVSDQVPFDNQFIMSESGSLPEAASNLFKGLRELDSKPVKVIFAEMMPETGLGRAINDRLRRSAAK
ncbi:L-threonylcarbamoyladenylate synthase [Aureibacter tunicatorum]|uniref:Threonylcarbamoyl-AMP synthase n=1 Tax=Aureibacter tunicatorum TaxID=866807 RepID=A0AAE4BR72_9BACT|nr:L-threonylcarbamoyladenylate synthase [Aureibacter tunicatorum]MDR6239919.1 L-threonylcarbamoyladenylate synthase [Aureibacter tunicatorum]BDD04394.1 threonylcarbamoyl-AMP synthase [Aureibacter tunicatorum]